MYPWSLVFLPASSRALVTERPGRMRLLDEKGLHAPLAGLPRAANLFDVAPAADFRRSARVYFSLVRAEDDALALEVWTARLGRGALLDARRVYRAGSGSAFPSILNAGRLLVIGPRELIVSVADRDDRDSRAQDVRAHWGKLVRVREDREPEIIATGVRNVQGIARDLNGLIWFTDHGPLGGDELNVLTPGANYGWPLSSAGRHYDGTPLDGHASHSLATTSPIVQWTPAIAPSSLLLYSGTEFPEWHGSFLVGSLVQRQLRRLVIRGGSLASEETLLSELAERIRDVRTDGCGRVYVLTDGLQGSILRISRARPADLPAWSGNTARR